MMRPVLSGVIKVKDALLVFSSVNCVKFRLSSLGVCCCSSSGPRSALVTEWIEVAERLLWAAAEAVVVVDVNRLSELELLRLESWAFWLVVTMLSERVKFS